MNTSNYIDQYIEKEKQIKANPFLSTRIMAGILAPEPQKASLWQSLAVAAGLALAVVSGLAVGTMYSERVQNYAALNINDSSMENLNLYYNLSDE